MSAMTIEIRRRDPAVIAARAHRVLDAVARAHAQWPAEGRPVLNEGFLALDTALEEYGTAADKDREQAAEAVTVAMAVLLITVSVFLGKAVADRMMRLASEVTA